jgi:hypothetical protein
MNENKDAVALTEPKVHNASTYSNHSCRCQACSADWAAYIAAARARRRQQVKLEGLPDTVEHGVSAYNNWGCKCPICKGAHNAARRAQRQRRLGVT